ncbi:MAG: 4Fe-4S dicluster domain-containing protein [Planctomycetota bacterium]
MKTVFTDQLKLLLDALAGQMAVYVPKLVGEHYVYDKYDAQGKTVPEINNICCCVPVKEFLFPMRELAAVYPKAAEPKDVEPFAVFGLKDCDLKSVEILDKVFLEEPFKDPFYTAQRENMLIISSDCSPAESCFCSIFSGKTFASDGFDLNVSKTKDGFIIETGSKKGEDFIEKHSALFTEVPEGLLAVRDENRVRAQKQLEQNNAEYKFEGTIKELVENNDDSNVFDVEAKDCVECQGCTRICPTCHCFYLYDRKQADYFAKMKMWDSCMRQAYAAVAGGANPRKILGDRLKHRLLHKLVYFFDRYGIDMCVGCGRCVMTCAGGIDMRKILKKLDEESKDRSTKQVKVAK